MHDDDHTAAGAKAENAAIRRRSSRVVPPCQGWRLRLLRALHKLEGTPGDEAAHNMMQAANMCLAGRTLGLSADIRANHNVGIGPAASYDDDLSELPIPYITPD
jgi:hypothetical protein